MKNLAINVELIKPVKEIGERRFKILKIREGTYEYGYYFHIANSRSGHNFIKQNVYSWVNQKEKRPRRNQDLENYSPKQFSINRKGFDLWKYPDSIIIVQVRDLLNWYASFVLFSNKKPNNSPEHTKLCLNIWLEIAKEYCGETNYLPDSIKVNYDDFFQSAEYRKNICNQIKGAEYNEDVIDVVTLAGRGSTFDKVEYQERASEMRVLERYKQLPEEYQHWWKVLIQHPEVIDLYLKHFEVSDEKRKFIDDIKYL